MSAPKAPRAAFGSRLGFILSAAGSAIGLGAIWKFPYMVGNNGGGAFLLLYLAALLGIGLTMMLAELALGRRARTDSVGALRIVGGGKWPVMGYSFLLAAFLILSFYCVVGGWTVGYLCKALTGALLSPSDGDFAGQFARFAGSRSQSVLFFFLFLALTIGMIAAGVVKGIERMSKILMPLLFLLMLAMIIRSVTLPGAMAGVRFFLVPELDKITPRTMIDALGFACFSLSLGFGAMLTYGSYMDKNASLVRSAAWVIVLQASCSVLAGLMVLPAVFALGMEAGQGPGLTYITLPAVFAAVDGGAFFAAVFFLLLLVAALTSSVSLVEPLAAFLIDQYAMRRTSACAVIMAATFVMGIPAAWSYGDSPLTVLGRTPFDLMDYWTSNIMLPVNVLSVCLLMGWRANAVFQAELLASGPGDGDCPLGRKLATYLNGICKFVAPLVIIAILVASLI